MNRINNNMPTIKRWANINELEQKMKMGALQRPIPFSLKSTVK